MAQEWDEYGKPITHGSTGPVQEWDEHGTPISGATGSTLSGTKGPSGAPQPTASQLGYDPLSSHLGGMAREAALGGISGFTGLPESEHPLRDLTSSLQQQQEERMAHPFKSFARDVAFGPAPAAYDMAKGLFGAGKEMATAPDVEGVAHGAGSFMGQLLQLSGLMKGGNMTATPEVTAAARAVEHGNAVNAGEVAMVNHYVRTPLTILSEKVNQAVGKQVNAVLDADELHNKITNNPVGYVNAAEHAEAARAASEKMGGEFANKVGKLIQRADGPMTMREAKALTTEVGKAAYSTTVPKEYAVLSKLYDGLHDATASRADDLGSAYGKAWQSYIDQTRTMKELQNGVWKNLMEDRHHDALGKLIDTGKYGSEIQAITKHMKAYGVDPTPLLEAQEKGQALHDSAVKAEGLLQGKFRAIQRHKFLASAGIVASATTAHLIPGMGFILPLLVAGKIGGMLDSAAVTRVLKSIKETVPPEAYNVTEPTPGPGPEPPKLPTQGLKMSTDSMGIKWAEDPLTGYKVSIPSRIAEGDVEAYARPKLQEQADIHGKIKGATPGQADDMADLQQSEEESRLDKAQRVRSIYKGRRR